MFDNPLTLFRKFVLKKSTFFYLFKFLTLFSKTVRLRKNERKALTSATNFLTWYWQLVSGAQWLGGIEYYCLKTTINIFSITIYWKDEWMTSFLFCSKLIFLLSIFSIVFPSSSHLQRFGYCMVNSRFDRKIWKLPDLPWFVKQDFFSHWNEIFFRSFFNFFYIFIIFYIISSW